MLEDTHIETLPCIGPLPGRTKMRHLEAASVIHSPARPDVTPSAYRLSGASLCKLHALVAVVHVHEWQPPSVAPTVALLHCVRHVSASAVVEDEITVPLRSWSRSSWIGRLNSNDALEEYRCCLFFTARVNDTAGRAVFFILPGMNVDQP
jgi:hypothetical protein